MAARIAMMAMTTSSSIKVNPRLFRTQHIASDSPLLACSNARQGAAICGAPSSQSL
jgi:hypothetical protein